MDDTVTIPAGEYARLKEDSRILGKLYAGGVDNWEWYSDSLYGDDEDAE